MRVLVACEESQAVCKAFRALGHEAYSCDIEPCSGGHPEWHIQNDVIPLINGHCMFQTADLKWHAVVGRWDMILAFPPCTHLAASGARWFEQKRRDGRQQAAIEFFMKFVNADCPKIVIENPVGIMSKHYRKPNQIIQPWQFGHGMSKATCLWLKGVPPLTPTNILQKPSGGWENQHYTNGRYVGFVNRDEKGKVLKWSDPRTAKIRSKTFPGIAKAMAEQWGGKNATDNLRLRSIQI